MFEKRQENQLGSTGSCHIQPAENQQPSGSSNIVVTKAPAAQSFHLSNGISRECVGEPGDEATLSHYLTGLEAFQQRGVNPKDYTLAEVRILVREKRVAAGLIKASKTEHDLMDQINHAKLSTLLDTAQVHRPRARGPRWRR